MSNLRFTPEQSELFVAASHDRNPLHLSPEYARKTPYGRPVVFGILGALACFGRVRTKPGCFLSGITLEFLQPMFVDIDYQLVISDADDQITNIQLYDGSTLLLKATLDFTAGSTLEPRWKNQEPTVRCVPADLSPRELASNPVVRGEYLPGEQPLAELMDRLGIETDAIVRGMPLATLLWSSYLVGMELPGLQALFYRLSLNIESLERSPETVLEYEARVRSLNSFNLLKTDFQLSVGGAPAAKGEAWALLRPKAAMTSDAGIEAVLQRSNKLNGKVALIVGASRGLGAMMTRALALAGCTVLANFQSSQPEARELKESLADAPGKVVLFQGDAGDLVWCQELKARVLGQYRQLDFLICNASPPLLPFRLEAQTVARINHFVGQALSLVTVPMALFLPSLAEASGWSVLISSISVETPVKEWPHYVALKCAVEGLVRVAAQQYEDVSFLLVRPPRMITDMTNTPYAFEEALPPEVAAAKVALRLQAEKIAGAVEVLHC